MIVDTQRWYLDCIDDAETVHQTRAITMTRGGDVQVWRDLYEKQRLTPVGHWVDIPYNPAQYGATGATWTVEAGDVLINRYALIGKTLCWAVQIQTSTLSADTSLVQMLLPAGLLVGGTGMNGVCKAHDGTWQHADVTAAAGSNVVGALKVNFSAWVAGAHHFYLYWTLVFEVQ